MNSLHSLFFILIKKEILLAHDPIEDSDQRIFQLIPMYVIFICLCTQIFSFLREDF